MTKIQNEQQYSFAMQRIEELLKIVTDDTPENSKESTELVLLSNLVADYEDERYPIKTPSLSEVLKLRMLEMGLTQKELALMLETTQSKISEMLSGKCEPTMKQARAMVRKLNISPAVVLSI